MKRILLFISLALASLQAYAQPAIADTTRVSLFDRGNKWSASLLDVKTYIGAGGGGGSVATDAIFDAKGDLPVGTGANTAAKLTVGTDGQELFADASASTGLRWGRKVISPAQITANQDDYSPTGWADARIVRLDIDGCYSITSFAATFDGDEKILINTSKKFFLEYPSEHQDGTAANRIADYGCDFIHYPGRATTIVYDGTFSRWRILNDEPTYLSRAAVYNSWSSASITTADWGDVAFVISGTGAVVGTSAGGIGIPANNTLSTGTTTGGSTTIHFAKTVIDGGGFQDAHISASAFLSIGTLSDGTNRFVASFSVDATANNSAENNNSVSIYYSDDINGGSWQGRTKSNAGVVSTVDLGVAVNTTDLYLLRIEVDKLGGDARFYINGVMRGIIQTNMPNAANCNAKVYCRKTLGTNARNIRLHSLNYAAIYPFN